jgi:AcrR family transcriptional regulator
VIDQIHDRTIQFMRSKNGPSGSKSTRDTKKVNPLTQIRREQLIAAAYKVINQKGYCDFTVADIAKEAELSVGLVHYYFRDKQSLLSNLFKDTQNRVRENLLAELAKASDPVEKLNIFIDQSFLLFWREKDYFNLLFEFWTQIKRNSGIRSIVQKLYRAYREELARVFQCGVERGIFREMDVSYTATICVSIVQHTIIQHLIDEKAFDMTEYATKIKQFIISMVMREGST